MLTHVMLTPRNYIKFKFKFFKPRISLGKYEIWWLQAPVKTLDEILLQAHHSISSTLLAKDEHFQRQSSSKKGLL